MEPCKPIKFSELEPCKKGLEPITILFFNTEKMIVYADKEETIRTGTLKLEDNGKGCYSYTYHPDYINPIKIIGGNCSIKAK